MRYRLLHSSILVFLLLICLGNSVPISLSNSTTTSSGIDIGVWSDRSTYTYGEPVIVYFTTSKHVDKALLRLQGPKYEERHLNYTGPGIGSEKLRIASPDRLGNWKVEFEVSILGKKYFANSNFTIVEEKSFRDDFNYTDLDELWAAGWSSQSYQIEGYDGYIRLENGSIKLDATPSCDPSIRYNVSKIVGSQDIKVFDWRLETSIIWKEGQNTSFGLVAFSKENGTRNRYCYYFNGYEKNIYFTKWYGEENNPIGNYDIKKGISYPIAFERRGEKFSFYFNNVLVYEGKIDVRYDPLEFIEITTGWRTSAVFENFSFRTVDSYGLQVSSDYGSVTGSGRYYEGEEVPVSVTPIINDTLGTRRIFSKWTDDLNSTKNPTTIMIQKPTSIIAGWKTQYYLSVESKFNNTIGSGWYLDGENAIISLESSTITLPDNSTQVFTKWTGGYNGTNPNAMITVNKPLTIEANWVQELTLWIYIRNLLNALILNLPNFYPVLVAIGGFLTTFLLLLQIRVHLRKPDIHISLSKGKISIQDSTKSVQVSLLLANIMNKKAFFGDFAKQITVNLRYNASVNNEELGLNAITGVPFLNAVGEINKTSNEIQSDRDIITHFESTFFQRSKIGIPQGRSETVVIAYGIEFGNKFYFASNPPIEIPLPENNKKRGIMYGVPFNLEVAGENLPSLDMNGNWIMYDSWDNWSYMASVKEIHSISKWQNFLIKLGFKKKIKLLK